MSHTSSNDFFFCLIRNKQRIEVRSEDESCRLTNPEDEETGDQEIVTDLNVMSIDEESGLKVLLLSTESHKVYAVKVEVIERDMIKLVDKETLQIDMRYKELFRKHKVLKDRVKRIFDKTLLEQIRFVMSQNYLEMMKELEKHEMEEERWKEQLEIELNYVRKLCGREVVNRVLSGQLLEFSSEHKLSRDDRAMYEWIVEWLNA